MPRPTIQNTNKIKMMPEHMEVCDNDVISISINKLGLVFTILNPLGEVYRQSGSIAQLGDRPIKRDHLIWRD